MKLHEVGEFGLIERIRKSTPTGPGVRLGIGDDAAWVKCRNKSLLITSDLLIEGVHFNLRWSSFYSLGYKSLAVNLSDVAAMGGTPAYVLLSLGIPIDFRTKGIEEFYRGLRSLASRCGVSLVGGDTNASDRLFISVSLLGYAPYGAVGRSGGKIGDDLYVTGTLGDSALGLDFLKKKKGKGKDVAYLVSRHQFPAARVKEGGLLARWKLAKSMIDISDGLLQDLSHLCNASGIGAVVWQDALPLSRPFRLHAGRNALRYALSGGEDYELLFSLRPRDRGRLQKLQKRFGVPVTRIGKCLPARDGIKVLGTNGVALSLPLSGYDHFKN